MNKVKNLIICSISILVIYACDTKILEEAINNFGIVVGLEPINTSTTIIITDAKTGEIINAPVNVSFEGKNKNDIIDTFSDEVTELKIRGGIINFGVKNEIIPNEQNPVDVKLKLNADGFKETVKNISISELGNSNFTVSMVNISNPPNGIVFKSDNNIVSTSADGKINDPINISLSNLDTDNNTETGVSFEFPKDYIFEGENGNPLVGELSINYSYYNPSDPKAINALPVELLENVNDSALVVVGATEISITDSSGNIAKNQSKLKTSNKNNTGEYIVNFILNSNTYAELNQLLRLAYISPTTAERLIIYKTPEVTALEGGRVELRYLLNTNLFQHMALVYFSEQPCNVILQINRNGNNDKLTINITEKGFLRAIDLQSGISNVNLRNVTRGTKKINVTLPSGNFNENIDLCGTSSPSINLPAPSTNLIDATMTVILNCTNSGEKVRVTDLPNASILYRLEDAESGTPWRVATNLKWNFNSETQVLERASCKVSSVQIDKNYDFKVSYDGNIAEKTILIDGVSVTYNETVDGGFCN
ncbi:hypothetical protein [Polaribacter sp.]|uniref:hypothetical protein n=1 Tax=Polaribacter sp. TaxID=1920175 RepID=UPI003F6AD595